MKKKALTTHEIAQYCDVTPRTVIQWIKEGKISAYRTPGRHSRVKVEDFFTFLKKYNMPIPKEIVSTEGNNIIRKKKILIVDDDKNMANSIKRFLKLKENYDIELAFDGFEAGSKIVIFKPDLVILDIKMPGMNGYEVTKKIRQLPELTYTKIIAISAFFKQKDKDKILATGANACLDKPFTQKELLTKINQLLK